MKNDLLQNSEFENRIHQLEVSMVRFIRTPNMIDLNHEISIATIIDLKDLKDLMVPFYEMTGLGVGLFDKNNKVLVSVGWQKICFHFHQKHPEANQSCIESERFFKKNFEPNKAISFKCRNGLWDIAYPLYIDDDFLGSIYFGQFFYDNLALIFNRNQKQGEQHAKDQKQLKPHQHPDNINPGLYRTNITRQKIPEAMGHQGEDKTIDQGKIILRPF